MRIEYDKDSHGLFIDFVVADDEHRYASSKEVAHGIVVDFDADGRAIGLEIEDVRGILDEDDVAAIVAPAIASGADLVKFRAKLGLTQDRLAVILEVPRNTIARWERGELTIEKSRMLALALAAIAGAERGRQSDDRVSRKLTHKSAPIRVVRDDRDRSDTLRGRKASRKDLDTEVRSTKLANGSTHSRRSERREKNPIRKK